jgi:hypothetical protein
MAIFDEHYRVVAVEDHRLTIRGVSSGKVLVINTDPDVVLNKQDLPVGKLISLSDPTTVLQN